MRKIGSYISCLVVLMTLVQCKSSYSNAQSSSERLALKNALSNEGIRFDAVSASPQNTAAYNSVANDILIQRGDNANRINLQGQGYSLRIKDDEVQMALPFYGERRLGGGGYNQINGPFNFTGPVKNLQVVTDEENNVLVVELTTQNNTESMDIDLKIYSGDFATVYINSAAHSFIRYTGIVDKIKEEE
ncbi:DUF4251 domain-containing protein [Nonlabens xiamenensis]|uniref:DUF4251 domain-containing protein n=1 Tax=Nonlabens xiamenensis TaxID=2341043 RepID=UPI000F610036|nr:DUF4251 domain-containing protein [Nonlabens xiamenensis]